MGCGIVPSCGFGGVCPHYRTALSSVRHMYASEGLRCFFRGVVPRLMARGPLSAASSLIYEYVLAASLVETAPAL